MARRGRAAAPAGRATLGEVRRKLERGWPSGLTVLSGDDLYHLDLAQRELLGKLVPSEATDFALTVYGDAKIDVGTAVAAARSVGMFAPTRVVLVRDVTVLDGDPAPLVDFAGRPPADAHLVVRAPQLDRRRKLHQALAGAGTQLVFGAPADAREQVAEVLALAADKRLALDKDAAELLAALCAGDLYRVASELDKLRVWSGKGGRLRLDLAAVRETAAGSGLLSGWEVGDALLARDAPRALAATRRLIESGEEPFRMMGALAYRARGMLQAKALIEAGSPPPAAARAARLWGVAPHEIARGLGRFTLREVLAFPATLMRADRDLKSRRLAGSAILEQALERMIGEDTR